MHGCVKAFTDGLLDLITPGALKKLAPRGTPADDLSSELLYLGPDENITPTDINWVGYSPARTVQPHASQPAVPRNQPATLMHSACNAHASTQVVDRAARRGYALPSSFMSSKPDAGINHKEFGVTSEGVAVFLHEALHLLWSYTYYGAILTTALPTVARAVEYMRQLAPCCTSIAYAPCYTSICICTRHCSLSASSPPRSRGLSS